MLAEHNEKTMRHVNLPNRNNRNIANDLMTRQAIQRSDSRDKLDKARNEAILSELRFDHLASRPKNSFRVGIKPYAEDEINGPSVH